MKTVKQIEQELHRCVMRCSIESRGLWYVMRHIIDHESDRPGHLQDGARPVFIEQLAHGAGCTTERASHWLKELAAAGVVESTDANVIFCPHLARAYQIRASGQRRAARSRADSGVLRAPDTVLHAPVRVLRAPKTVLRAPDVTPPARSSTPPPPASLPPLIPPIPSPPDPLFAAGAAMASVPDAAAGGKAGKGAAGRGKRRVRTDAEHATWREFRRWFCEDCWPRYHGGQPYDFDSESRPQRREINYAALWRFLDHDAIGFDAERARKTAEYFAEFCADHHVRWDAPLQRLASKAEQYWQKSQLPRSSRVIGQHSIAADQRRGLYPSEFQNLRVSGGLAG